LLRLLKEELPFEMAKKTYRKSQIAQHLYDAKSIDDKFSILENEVLSLGFDAVLYTFIPKLSRLSTSLKPVFQYSERYNPLIKYYQKHDFSRHDFVIRLAEERTDLEVIEWWEEAQKNKLNEKEIQVNLIMIKKFSFTKGITFPTLQNDQGLAGVSVISFKEEYKNKKVSPELLENLKHCVRMYHDHMMIHQDIRYEFILPILKTLTPKKKLVIKHLISGQPMKNITEAGVTERYAEKLLLELRKTFGNISKNELIYLLGLLNIVEYL